MKKIIIAFVPVLHEGYRKFFEKHADADTLYIFGKKLIEQEFPHLQKEIRALDPQVMQAAIGSLSIFKKIEVLESPKKIPNKVQILMPDEDVSRELAKKYLKNRKVTFDKVFLRLDKHKSMEERPVEVDQKISHKEFDKKVIARLKIEAEKSSDWWRRIGAAVFKNEKLLFKAHNEHLPSAHTPYTNGDPRNNFHKGVEVELSTAIHAEASIVAQAAKAGKSLEGASLYATIFPCPPCAKLIAKSGIKKLYYAGGYALLDQDKLLKDHGVEIVYVKPN